MTQTQPDRQDDVQAVGGTQRRIADSVTQVGRVVRCAWCGDLTDRSRGPFLSLLYPDGIFCRGCGRRTLYCVCDRGTIQ